MQKLSFCLAMMIGFMTAMAAVAAQPAPPTKGIVGEETDATEKNNGKAENPENSDGENSQAQSSDKPKGNKALRQQIADLQSEIQTLKETLDQVSDSQKKLMQLTQKLGILENENSALSKRVKSLETEKEDLANRVKSLEGDNAALLERTAKLENDEGPQTRTAAKPAFVKSAVRFFNHEGRRVKINVNGVWHTLNEGENLIWVPYAPVHIYRYNDAEPRTFWKWKPHMDGYVMDFDVGTPPQN